MNLNYASMELRKDSKIYVKDYEGGEYYLVVGGLRLNDYKTAGFVRVISHNEYDRVNKLLDEIISKKLN
ncbi:hypothetical protein [Clostridium botulinum]|nr:hypothetical protein [Clostridium botulinum]